MLNLKYRAEHARCAAVVGRLQQLQLRWAGAGAVPHTPPPPPPQQPQRGQPAMGRGGSTAEGGSRYENPLLRVSTRLEDEAATPPRSPGGTRLEL